MKLSDALEKYGLYDQVFLGIDYYFEKNDSIKNLILTRIDHCEFKFFDTSVKIAGSCKGSKLVRIHELLKKYKGDLEDTLLHETAHMIHDVSMEYYRVHEIPLTWKANTDHGTEWKNIVTAIGGTRNVYHSYPYLEELEVEKAKHKYICRHCGYEYLTMRKLKNIHRRYHKKCGHILGKLKHIQLR